MIKVEVFKIDHLKTFEPKEDFEYLERDMTRNIMDFNKSILTLMVEDKTLAILGVTKFRQGAGELWLLPSVHVDKHPKEFFRVTRNLIYTYVFPQLQFHRLEIAIMKGWRKGMKWAEKLGFELSHVCDHYDVLGNDHYIYKKVVK